MTQPDEQQARAAIEAALKALVRAAELVERVGYGQFVLEPLEDAQKSARCALNAALDRA